ncbi:MAG: hypothetical protein K2Q20_14895 [Phycisphaerales bacterium]|nr:hypothetical protein [Phycisphaerales bacterium]
MTRVSAISSPRRAQGRAQGAGSVTLLVLVMLALAASPSIGKALAASGSERATPTRASVGGEQAIHQQRQTSRQRASQRVHPAAVVVLDRSGRVALASNETDTRPGLPTAAMTVRVREALLALPPPAC